MSTQIQHRKMSSREEVSIERNSSKNDKHFSFDKRSRSKSYNKQSGSKSPRKRSKSSNQNINQAENAVFNPFARHLKEDGLMVSRENSIQNDLLSRHPTPNMTMTSKNDVMSEMNNTGFDWQIMGHEIDRLNCENQILLEQNVFLIQKMKSENIEIPDNLSNIEERVSALTRESSLKYFKEEKRVRRLNKVVKELKLEIESLKMVICLLIDLCICKVF